MNYLNKKTVEDIDVAGKRVLVRCDFNVPFDGEGNISDPKRINEALKTIKYLIDHKAKVILCSHLGRPKGEFNMKYSLRPSPNTSPARWARRSKWQPTSSVRAQRALPLP